MLSPRAIKRFRARALDSWNFMKKLSRRELVNMVCDLDPVPEFYISPRPIWKHQLAAFLIGVHMPHFLFFIDMGGGKTRVILELIAYRKLCGEDRAALIITVDDTNIENWVMEAEEHRPDLNVIPMYGSTADRYDSLEEGGDVYVAHYAALYHMLSYIPKPRRELQKGEKLKRKISKARLNNVSKYFYKICLDECTKIMNKKSLTFRTCLRFGSLMDCRYGLAGRPLGRDPTNLWSQFLYCDHGETLGQTLGLFREVFFKQRVNSMGFYEWKFDKRRSRELNRTIQHRSITYAEKEFREVPKVVKKPIYVDFTEDMKAYYNKIVDQLRKGDGDLRMMQNSFLHMRQIASGFIGLIDDETGARAQLEFPENPKMDALRDMLEEMQDSGRRFLIYHQYTWTGNRIARELDSLGCNFLRLRGGQKKKNPGILRKFRKSKMVDGLILQNQVGSYGLNLQVASVEHFIETPTSPIDREQAEKRVRPALNPKRCMFFDYMMRDNSAEENIQKYLKEGRDMKSAIMGGRNPFGKIRRVK